MNKIRSYLGIDTSNYTTSVALCAEDGTVLENFKLLLGVAEGERGLRQSDAVFSHVKNFPVLAEQVRRVAETHEILAVGYSATPRPADGSYMPCFLVGRAVAEMLAATLNVPIYPFSHQEGHIMAAVYSSGNQGLLERDFIAFHVSGGITEVVSVTPKVAGFTCSLIGGTADLNAGQAIDRVGVKMGLRFPCGKELEALAQTNQTKVPKPKIAVKGKTCNLSGLENMAEKLYATTGDKALTAAFTLDFVAETLYRISCNLREELGEIPILYAGGVMSNRRIQARLGVLPLTNFSEPQFSADNAAGTALLCRAAHMKTIETNEGANEIL